MKMMLRWRLNSFSYQFPVVRWNSTKSSARNSTKRKIGSDATPLGPPLPPLKPSGASSMLNYIHHVQKKYPEAVVLSQVGSFMEIYFDQAARYGPLLNLKVAQKSQTSPVSGQPVIQFAGFPLNQKEKYERMLVHDMGLTVVTLMQDSKEVLNGGSEEEKRPISRILTPGTLLGESFVDEYKSNFLASLHIGARQSSLMWVDVAHGNVMYEELGDAEIGNALARISPSEIIIDKKMTRTEFAVHTIKQYAPNAIITRSNFPPLEWWRVDSNANDSTRFKIDNLKQVSQRAFLGLASYISQSLPGTPIEIQPPVRFLGNTVMELDASARSSLDLTITNGASSGSNSTQRTRSGSLFHTIKRTQTSSGTRLLYQWLAAPLLSIEEINSRQDKVEYSLNQDPVALKYLQELLAELPDGPRVLQKLRSVTVNPLDLVAYAQSVVTIEKIQNMLKTLKNPPESWTEPLYRAIQEPIKVARHILRAIKVDDMQSSGEREGEQAGDTATILNSESDEEAIPAVRRKKTSPRKSPSAANLSKISPASHRDYRPVLNEDAFEELHDIYTRRRSFEKRENAIRERLINKYGSTVELRWSPVHEHHIAIKLSSSNEPDSSLVLARSKRTVYFFDKEWHMLGSEMLQSSADLRKEEERILDHLRQLVLRENLPDIRRAYSVCDEIDVISSFTQLAREYDLVRPVLVEEPGVFEIKDGRHLAIEIGLAVNGHTTAGFVANDCNLSSPQPVCMITGPNMGGKSTYLRQNAIIALLAQTGCYVPAASAKIGIIDRIFCRIGAGDDLYRGRSTFMVEMLEAAEILNSATERSLAIVDEVGRGTSNNDGVAIAFAAIKHLALRTKCRVLFATHYGTEIKQLLESEQENELVKVIKLLMAQLNVNSDGTLKFNYRLEEGIAQSSRGLLIAELAGFPDVALKDAQEIVKNHNYV